MRLPRAIYLLPPQGKSFLICPKHFSFVISAASLTLWNVCGLQVWIASEECKWMLCVAQPHCQAAASLSNLTRAKNLWLLYTTSFLPLSFSPSTLSCISATAITIKHHRHFYSTFRLRLFAVFRQALSLFSFPFLVSLSPQAVREIALLLSHALCAWASYTAWCLWWVANPKVTQSTDCPPSRSPLPPLAE